MSVREPNTTQRAGVSIVAEQLAAAGFEGAQEIGRGGFGIVYRCTQVSLERDVALKVLRNSPNPENLARFIREQRAMGRLSGHPNIVSILSAGTTKSGLSYIAMPYFAADSLGGRIGKNGSLQWEVILGLGVRIAGALESAHRCGILHRDVKPANILFTDWGDPQLADFGIAHVDGAFDTATGVISGSPAFIAPEVLTGERPSISSDVYGLGATLFCGLTGHAPFELRRDEQLVAQLLRITTEPTPCLHGRSGVPDDVAEVIDQAIARDPADRPTTAALFGDQLRSLEQRHNSRVDEMVLLPGSRTVTETEGPLQSNTVHPPFGPDLAGKHAPSTAVEPKEPRPRDQAGNLPLELTSFVGRRRELATAKNNLSSSRLVTLTGAGGVGKTRLALRLANDSRRTFANGVWLVELGGVRDELLVAGTVAASLGILNQSADLPSSLAEYLVDKSVLLVLDNCEHLVDSIAALTESLLRACPKLKILATSREQLRIAGEAVVRVPPLVVPEADRPASRRMSRYESVILFAERAAAAVPGFELTEDNENTVAQICRRLDGLPLAIELAVGRLRSMSCQQILARLDKRYLLLTQGSRVAPSRQQTLQICVDWSYDLCTADEQTAWTRMTVFAGSFELEAAETICGTIASSTDFLDSVAQLVDKSILIREQLGATVRYRLLDTLREYGQAKLQVRGEYTELRRRHRDWYERLAQQADTEWISPRQMEWNRWLDVERPNLHEALRFCLTEEGEASAGLKIAAGLYPLWACRGLLSEGRLWFSRLLATDNTEPAERAKALCLSSILAGLQGDVTAADSLVAEATRICEQLGDPSLSALVEHASGCVALYAGAPQTAIVRSKEAIRVARELDPFNWLEIGALMIMGVAAVMLGDVAQAALCHERLLAATEDRGDLIYRGKSSMAGGWALWKLGDPERAKEMLRSGLRLSDQIDDYVGVTRCLTVLAWIEADQQNAKRAVMLLGATAGLCKKIGSPTVKFLENLDDHRECARRTRKDLGDNLFSAQIQIGSSLRLHGAVAYALDEEPSAKPKGSSTRNPSLTRREREIAELVAEGLTNRVIATRLVISQRTVQGHVEHILIKLDFTSRTQIAVWVRGQGSTEDTP